MRQMGRLCAITMGFGTALTAVASGCGGETVQITSGGNAAAGGNGNTSSSSGSSMGGGGASGGCSSAADCSDGFSCTIDTCNAGVCKHGVGPNSGETSCPVGQMCNVDMGCVEIIICADDAPCIEKLGGDPCKANVHCDLGTSVCSYTILDKDDDGEAPVVCNGKDCDDSRMDTNTGAMEICDGHDNNCNGAIDETATCPGLTSCQGGACVCPPANRCGPDCVDLTISNDHCGTCNNACGGGSSCSNGQCVCPGNSTYCGNTCVDTTTDSLNCGGCNNTCAGGYSCVNSVCTCLNTSCGTQCIDTMNDPLHCGGCNRACPFNSQCQNGTCICPTGQTSCNGQCVDTQTNPTHCGGCNKPCNGVCQNGTCSICPATSLYYFVDNSASMAGVKLTAVRNSIGTFLADPMSAGMRVGLGFHPVPTTNTGSICLATGMTCVTDTNCAVGDRCYPSTTTASCNLTDYQTPAVGIALLPGVTSAINNALAAATPAGLSTPPPGLRGALQYAKNYAIANPTENVGVVYILDSMPSTCNIATSGAGDLVAIAQQFANGTPRIVTYVIGLPPEATLIQMNQIATAGGTTTGYLAMNETELLGSLSLIRSKFRNCP